MRQPAQRRVARRFDDAAVARRQQRRRQQEIGFAGAGGHQQLLDRDAMQRRQLLAQFGQPLLLVVVARMRDCDGRPEPVRLGKVVHPRLHMRAQEAQQLELGELHDAAAKPGLRALSRYS